MELAALERLKISHRLIMGKWCLQASSFIFDRIFVKLACNQDSHKISDEFEFRLDRISHFGVTCPCGRIKFSIDIWNLQVHLTFQTLEFFVTLFLGTVKPRRLKLGTHLGSGQMYHVYWNQAAAAYSSLHFFIFLSLQFSTLKFFVTLSSGTVRPRRLKLGTHVDSGQMYHVYRNQPAAVYSSFISSFFFQFSTLKIFITLFSGTWRPRRLKIGTRLDSGQMYHVYQNQAAASYSSLYFFIFLSLQFSTLKFFITLFSGTVRPRRLKLGTLIDSAQMYHVYQNQAAAAYWSPYFFIFLSLQFSTLKFFVTLFLETMRPRRLKLDTHMDSGQLYHVYQNQAAASYSSLYFFIFLSLQFSTLKFLVTLFSGTVRPRGLKLGTHVDTGQMYDVYQNQVSALVQPFISSFFFLSNFQH